MIQLQKPNSSYVVQPVSKTPVTGYQTLDSMGDASSYELKIPVSSSDTDRGVSKSIFYGTQRISNLKNNEIQRYANDRNSHMSNHSKNDFSKTQAINMSQSGYHSNANERSAKNVTHRAESASRQSGGNPSRSSQ